MKSIVRYSMDELRKVDVSEELTRVAELPDDQINTEDIPERRFDVARALRRREEGWRPGAITQKKAS